MESVKKNPLMPGNAKTFTDVGDALKYIQEIYETNTDWIREQFHAFAAGATMPDADVEAHYPYVAVTVGRRGFSALNKRLPYGFARKPGRYSTTVTQLDLYYDYLLEQLSLLRENHPNAPLEVGVSETPIPLEYAFSDGSDYDAGLSLEKARQKDWYFTPTDPKEENTAIIDGYYEPKSGEDFPLSSYPAPLIDKHLQLLRHHTGTDPQDFQRFVLLTNYKAYLDAFREIGEELVHKGSYEALVGPRVEGHQMPAWHLQSPCGDGISIVKIDVGPSNANTMIRELAVLRPDAVLMLGHCAGLQPTQAVGQLVLATSYVNFGHELEPVLPPNIPITAPTELEQAIEASVARQLQTERDKIKQLLWRGSAACMWDRFWETSSSREFWRALSLSGAFAFDMESYFVVANAFRHSISAAALLDVTDLPLSGHSKRAEKAQAFYKDQTRMHVEIGISAMEYLRDQIPVERLHPRSLRRAYQPPFR